MLNSWSISPELIAEVEKLHFHGNMLEIGSGEGTLELRKLGTVYSIEHDSKYAKPDDGANRTFLVPLDEKAGWYQENTMHAVTCFLRSVGYDIIIVDAPPGNARKGFIDNIAMFDTEATIILDDSHRQYISDMADSLVARTGRQRRDFNTSDGRKFTII